MFSISKIDEVAIPSSYSYFLSRLLAELDEKFSVLFYFLETELIAFSIFRQHDYIITSFLITSELRISSSIR